jgi:hypothetical protein
MGDPETAHPLKSRVHLAHLRRVFRLAALEGAGQLRLHLRDLGIKVVHWSPLSKQKSTSCLKWIVWEQDEGSVMRFSNLDYEQIKGGLKVQHPA